MKHKASILLAGLRGSGKTTLGRLLAANTGRTFCDLDDRTVAILGRSSVADAFTLDGETAFRIAETRALRESLGRANAVIALGGGTPTAPGAAGLLREAARTHAAVLMYLRAEPSTLRARLGHTDAALRPSLTGKEMLDEIDDVFEARDALYRSLADAVITVDDLTLEEALALLTAAATT